MFNDIDFAQIFSAILPLIHPYQIEFSVRFLYGWHEKNVKGFRYSGHNLSSVFTLKFTSQTASCWLFFQMVSMVVWEWILVEWEGKLKTTNPLTSFIDREKIAWFSVIKLKLNLIVTLATLTIVDVHNKGKIYQVVWFSILKPVICASIWKIGLF